jgi:hypothetical protein
MHDSDTALRHQVTHITITQVVSDVPPYGMNDKNMVEMAAVEERGLFTRELGHAGDYP